VTEFRGLIEMRAEDPDGLRIILVEVPADHPLRRDPRSASPPRMTEMRRKITGITCMSGGR